MTQTNFVRHRSAWSTVLVFFAAVALLAASARAADPLDCVDVRQGTAGTFKFSHGSTLPLVGVPWGFTDWAVQTTGDVTESRFFDPAAKTFAGIRATRQPSPWVGDHGQLLILPQVGPAHLGLKERATTYDPATAVMRPDYVKVTLPDAAVEMTAASHSAVFRFTFDKSAKVGRIVLDPAGPGELRAGVGGNTFAGFSGYHRLGAPSNFKAWFAGQLDRPITAVGEIGDEFGRKEVKANRPAAGYVEVDLSRGPTVTLTVGTSFISNAQAVTNATAEAGLGFDLVRDRTARVWANQLGRINVEGPDEQRRTFYSCLYRSLKFPHTLAESDPFKREAAADGGGSDLADPVVHYSPWDGKVHLGPAYTDDGLWDTYRTQFPLLSIAYADRLGDVMAGWLNAYREGGWLPNWPSPGGFNGMPGTHADVVFADAMVKGITGFNYQTAYAAVRRDAVTQGGGFGGGKGKLNAYLEHGYLPAGPGVSGATDTLDYALDDWAASQAATVTGHGDEAAVFRRRGMFYRNVWNPAVGFMRARNADKTWAGPEPFDPFAWGGAYVEGGPWQCSWAVPQDVAGLAELAGGRAAFAKRMDDLFATPPTFHPGGYGTTIHEMTEMAACGLGQCSLNNQPSFHVPYLFAAVGQPWKTEYWTRRACRTLFTAGPDGYPGDEDTGSMGAWYVLSSIGLYPLTPGHPSYVLTSPVFKRVTVHLPDGKAFVVTADGNSDDAVYVRRRTLNGRPYGNVWLSHADLAAGGRMDLTMAADPLVRPVADAELPYSASTDPVAAGR